MKYDDYFESFCKALFRYQYVQQKSEITPAIMEWLYEHSAGILAVVVALVYSAQEIAILTGKEILNLETLNRAYRERMEMMHDYIQPTITHNRQTSKPKKHSAVAGMDGQAAEQKECTVEGLAARAKSEKLDIVMLLKEHFVVVEVPA